MEDTEQNRTEFDIMVLAMIAVTATTVAGFVSAYFLGKGSGGTDFGEEVLTNSTIENEEKKSIASWFYFDFENGNIALILILASGILLFIITLGCCLFFVVVEYAREEEEKISIENTFMHIDINSTIQMEWKWKSNTSHINDINRT